MRTRERKCFQSMRTVRDISRDDRTRLRPAVCEQRQTDLRRIIVQIVKDYEHGNSLPEQ